MKRQPTVADIIMLAGGAVTFLFSFLPFVGDGTDYNAWSSDLFGLFPVTTIIAVLGLAMVVFVLLEWLVGFTIPTFLTFTYKQMYVTWGVVAAVLMLAYLIMDKHGGSSKAGLWLMLLGSLAMAVGAILNVLGVATETVGGGARPTTTGLTGTGTTGTGYTPAGYTPAPPAAPSAPPPPPPPADPNMPPPPPPPT
jgi:hypothetical protein